MTRIHVVSAPRLRSLARQATNIVERDHQRHRLSWRRLEAKRLIEGFGPLGGRGHDDAADADCVRRVRNTQCAMAKEGAAEAPALLRTVNLGSGMLRRKRPTLPATAMAPETSA